MVTSLSNMWSNYYTNETYLYKVEIGGQQTLRGIKNSELEFRFPLTVLCGPNSTGKTTFLALSVLAFHDDSSQTLFNSRKGYYDFSYFFGFSEKEKHKEGICIKWSYTNRKADAITKGRERWMRYIKNSGDPRRPKRGTEFIGLSRIVPAFEKRGYQKLFANTRRHKIKTSPQKLEHYLTQIMLKPYSQLASYETTNAAGTHRLNDYKTHTSFNAGAGEECLTLILDTLLSAKKSSVIAIEEIEIGLHPATMKSLVDTMLEIIQDRKLQVIITTHSPEFLRACPKESLILAERSEEKIVFTHQPNIENAICSLSGKSAADLYIVCEDEWSAYLIEALLSKKQRDIVSIKGYGGKDELISKAEAIRKATGKKILIIWDGDVENKLLTDAASLSLPIPAVKLPGSERPEKYLLDVLVQGEVKDELMKESGLEEGDWFALTSRLSSISDSHTLFYVLADQLSLDEKEIGKRICKMVLLKKEHDFANVKQIIETTLSTP